MSSKVPLYFETGYDPHGTPFIGEGNFVYELCFGRGLAGMAGLADLELLYYVSFQKIGAFSKPDRFWKPVGFFPELLSMYFMSILKLK